MNEEMNYKTGRNHNYYDKKQGMIDNDFAWKIESWGSASAPSASMKSIYEAYNESKICDEW